jgi:hypothetical protein
MLNRKGDIVMTRKDIFKVCLVLAATISASSAYANTPITGATVIGGGTFSPSNKVTINVVSTATDYAAKSGHSSGDRTIFTTNTDPKMVWTIKTIGSAPETVSGATETVSGWTSL